MLEDGADEEVESEEGAEGDENDKVEDHVHVCLVLWLRINLHTVARVTYTHAQTRTGRGMLTTVISIGLEILFAVSVTAASD